MGIAFFVLNYLHKWFKTNRKGVVDIEISKDFPSLERRSDGSLYRMTPAQRKRANALIRRECCNYDNGKCLMVNNGYACVCPQTISFSVCCKCFRFVVLPQDQALEAEIFQDKKAKHCAVCGHSFVAGSNRAKYCPDCAAKIRKHRKAECERKRRTNVDD